MSKRTWRVCLAAVLVTLLTGWFSTASALMESTPWLHRSWQTDEGLPDNSVTGLAQARDDYMWGGTARGELMRVADGKPVREI